MKSGELDYAAVTKRAVEALEAHPRARNAVVTAANDVSFEVVVRTMEAIRGPGCEPAQPDRCILPGVIIEAGAE